MNFLSFKNECIYILVVHIYAQKWLVRKISEQDIQKLLWSMFNISCMNLVGYVFDFVLCRGKSYSFIMA